MPVWGSTETIVGAATKELCPDQLYRSRGYDLQYAPPGRALNR